MKKILSFALVFMLACLFLDKIGGSDLHMQFNGDEVDGPLEWLFGMAFAGGGLLIALAALVCAAVVAGMVIAGVGVFVVAGLAIACGVVVVVLLALSSPVLLPLLILAAFAWLLVGRNRRQRAREQGI